MEIKWNQAGFEELRKCPDMQKLVVDEARGIARSATGVGKGVYVSSARMRSSRYGAIVYPADFRAAYYNRRDNVLLTAMVAGSVRIESEKASPYRGG